MPDDSTPFAAPLTEQVQSLPLSALQPSPLNPRSAIDLNALAELTEDIRRRGVLQPVVVRYLSSDGSFELIFGHRRSAAAVTAGLTHVPAIVRSMTDAEVLAAQLAENLQREDFSPLDEARGYARLREALGGAAVKVEELAAQVGKSRRTVYQRLQLLQLAPEVQDAVPEIGAEVASYIARVPAAHQVKALALARATDWRGQPKSTRQVRAELADRFTLLLEEAPWPLDDAGLLPSAGACTACPKRSGANLDLLGDLIEEEQDIAHTGPDVCADPDCFAAKKAALRQREAAELAARTGREVIGGEAARRAIKEVYRGRVELKAAAPFVPLAEVKAALRKAKQDAPAPVLLQDPASGKTIEAVRRKDLEAAGIKVEKRDSPVQAYDKQRQRAEADRAARAAKAAAEQAVRLEIFTTLQDQLRARARTADELRAVLAMLLADGFVYAARAAEPLVLKRWNVKNVKELAARVPTLQPDALAWLLLEYAAAHGVAADIWNEGDPTALLSLAALNDVDVEAIRKRIAEARQAADPKAKAAPAADKLAGKAGKGPAR